jgi:hypothetical protein
LEGGPGEGLDGPAAELGGTSVPGVGGTAEADANAGSGTSPSVSLRNSS